MDCDKIARSIKAAIEKRPEDKGVYTDLFSLCRSWEEEDFAAAHAVNKELLNQCAGILRQVDSKEAAFMTRRMGGSTSIPRATILYPKSWPMN